MNHIQANFRSLRALFFILALLTGFSVQSNEPILIGKGRFVPLYGLEKDQKDIEIKSFYLDPSPITNQQFLDFIKSHPEWRPKKISPLLADQDYLKHWMDDGPPPSLMNAPVVFVSWFAANEYCISQKGRLPTVFEWEYVANTNKNEKELLTWYSTPMRESDIQSVGRGRPNAWGIYDMHGMIWEWTHDFNGVFVTGDNRQDSDDLKNLFCGFGSFASRDKTNYVAYGRYALRNSLKANYTLMSLGFRCAYSMKDAPRD